MVLMMLKRFFEKKMPPNAHLLPDLWKDTTKLRIAILNLLNLINKQSEKIVSFYIIFNKNKIIFLEQKNDIYYTF